MAQEKNSPVDETSAPSTTALEAEAPEPASSPRLGSEWMNRAKAAREQAQSSVGELASKASGVAASKAGDLKGQLANKASELKDASFGKLVETLDDFNAALPVLREAGYTLANVDIGIGLPPRVSASFSVSSEVSTENIERLLVEHAERKFTLLLVKALYQAWQLQNKIKIVGLQPKGLSVEIGLIPAVSVKFA